MNVSIWIFPGVQRGQGVRVHKMNNQHKTIHNHTIVDSHSIWPPIRTMSPPHEQRFIVNSYWKILKTIPKNQKLKMGHMAPIGDGFVHLDMISQRTFFRGSWNWPGNSFRKISCLMTRNCKIWKKSGNRFRDLPFGVNLTDKRSSARVNFGTRIWHKLQTSAESEQIPQPKWDFQFSTKSY